MTSTSRFSSTGAVQEQHLPGHRANLVEDHSVWERVPRQMPAASGDEVHLHGDFPTQKQVRVIISQQALVTIDAHAHSDLLREVGGALLGRVVRYQAQTFVEVLAAVVAETADHGPVHFTFTADTWSAINRAREREYRDLEVVGWFHTHPDLGVFYSSDDVVVHAAAFTLPWQVGLVVDPIRQEACFFGWEHTAAGLEVLPIAGFYEWLDAQTTCVIEWDVTHQHHFSASLRGSSQVQIFPVPTISLPPISPWWGVALGGMSLVIALFLLIDRFWLSG